jgi:hypothetical protein
MTEKQEAIILANRILERPNADPDDDLAMLARQFLRSRETIETMHRTLAATQDSGMDLVHANRDTILSMYEEAVRRVRKHLESGLKDDSGMKYGLEAECKTALVVLDALSQFHPMHGESWQGWPKETEPRTAEQEQSINNPGSVFAYMSQQAHLLSDRSHILYDLYRQSELTDKQVKEFVAQCRDLLSKAESCMCLTRTGQ